jgi:hypothetical protein
MPVELFGFSLGRKKESEALSSTNLTVKQSGKAKSFVTQEIDDAYTIDAGGVFGTYVDLDGALKTENDYIKKYREMANQPECEQAVEDICNEAIVYDEQRYPVSLVTDFVELPASVKKSVHEEFRNILRLLDFQNRGYEIFRRWYIDGKGYYHMIVDPKNVKKGIIEMRPVDAAKIKKIAKVEKDTDAKTGAKMVKSVKEVYVYREKPDDPKGLEIAPEAVNYYPSGLMDPSRARAISYLHKAIKPLNQLRMVEDATVIYRLSRAPERRIFYVDVGSLPKTKAEQYVRELMNRYRNKLVYDATTGDIRDDRKYMSMMEDFWFPRREGGKGTQVDTLQGGQNLGEMDDVLYFEKKLYRALSVPLSRIESDTGFNMGRASEIDRDELNFQKFIHRLRNKFNVLFLNALRVQLILKGVITEEEWYSIVQDLRFDYVSDSFFTESKDYEIIESRLRVLRDMNDYIGEYYSREWVRRNILRQTDRDMEEQDKQIDKERELGILPPKSSEGMGF